MDKSPDELFQERAKRIQNEAGMNGREKASGSLQRQGNAGGIIPLLG